MAVEVEVHLPGIRVGELASLEIDENQTTQHAVIEHEVDAIPFGSDANSFCPPNHCGK